MMMTHSLALLTASVCASLDAADLPDFSKAQPGETLRLPPGRYGEPIVIDGLKGERDKPIRIIADPGAVLYGTRRLDVEWERWRDGIWRAKLDFDVWQLFIGERLVYVARWPDATFEDGSIWRMTQCMRNTDHGWNYRKKEPTGKTRPGLIYDAPFKSQTGREFREGDGDYGAPSRQGQSLAESGKDFSGAMVVINGYHWITWTRPVLEHGKGSDHFTYDRLVGRLKGPQLDKFKNHVVYYILGLPALDRPNEWWFDSESKTVYLMPPDGKDPNDLDVRGKARDHGIVLRDCADLSIEGLHVFGQGFKIDRSQRIRFEDCRFDYPATHRFLLREFAITTPWRTGYASALSRTDCRDVAFVNCRFAYSNAPLYLAGEGTRVENCLFHDTEWDVNSSGGCGTIVTGKDSIMRRCTVMRSGNSEGIRPCAAGNTISLCHLTDMGNLQYDGAAINVGTDVHIGCLVEKNWAHDSNRQGVRFDYHDRNGKVVLREDGKIHGDGVYLRNVTWNCQPNQVKGDRHIIANNTVVNCTLFPDPARELMNMGVMGYKALHGLDFNEESVTRNNLANLAHRSWGMKARNKPDPFRVPGIVDHNVRERGAAYRHLRDPVNFDFRPIKGSPLVDGGQTVAPEEVKSPVSRFKSLDFAGKAPDIGAYEHGDKRYWIPGYQYPHASTPVPPDGSTTVKPNADLMFLEGYKAKKHILYFGTALDGLERKQEMTDTNIFTPEKLEPGRTYFWRVDAISDDGGVVEGPAWRFTVETSRNTPAGDQK